MVKINLDEFLSKNFPTSSWIQIPHGQIYFRKAMRCFQPYGQKLYKTLDIANIQIEPSWQRQGIFKEFLKNLEEEKLPDIDVIYIENLIEEWFQNWFKRNDWEPIKNHYSSSPVSFIKWKI